ncbi:MAG: hypothetical protein ACLT8I_23660 [Blautia faecis]
MKWLRFECNLPEGYSFLWTINRLNRQVEYALPCYGWISPQTRSAVRPPGRSDRTVCTIPESTTILTFSGAAPRPL